MGGDEINQQKKAKYIYKWLVKCYNGMQTIASFFACKVLILRE